MGEEMEKEQEKIEKSHPFVSDSVSRLMLKLLELPTGVLRSHQDAHVGMIPIIPVQVSPFGCTVI